MKLLLILPLLVCFAQTAPTEETKGIAVIENNETAGNQEKFNREKKSPQVPKETGFSNNDLTSGRSHLDFKGPIVVKNKGSYHFYRNSGEERGAIGSGEKCTKHMRFKICVDDSEKSSETKVSPSKRDTEQNNNEELVRLAKEAIDRLRNELKVYQEEHQTTKSSPLELREKIDSVRQALHKLHSGKMETMNLRAATLKEIDEFDNFNHGFSKEERLAQWKQAMQNIQRNVEVARNIEDSFKTSEQQFIPSEVETTHFARNQNHESVFNNNFARESSLIMASSKRESENDMSDAASMQVNTKEMQNHANQNSKKTSEMSMNVQSTGLKLKKDEQHAELDNTFLNKESSRMATSESKHEMSTDLVNHNLNKNAESSSVKVNSNSNIALMKENDVRSSLSAHGHFRSESKQNSQNLLHSSKIRESSNDLNMQEKSVRSNTEHERNMKSAKQANVVSEATSGIENSKVFGHNNIQKSFNQHNMQEKSAWTRTQHEKLMKSKEQANLVNSATSGVENSKVSKHSNNIQESSNHQNIQEKSAWTVTQNEKMAKSAEQGNFATAFGIENTNENSNLFMKSAQNKNENIEKTETLNKNSESDKFLNEKSASSTHDMRHSDHGHDHFLGHEMHIPHHDFNHIHSHHDMHLNHGMHGLHTHIPHGTHMHIPHGMHMPNHIHHVHGHHHLKHGKSSEIDVEMQPSSPVKLWENAAKSASENMEQWKHRHEAARSSYGSGYSLGGLNLASAGGSEAVGLFPNARVGGCGVPLLLSCSPSVVSGSLVHSHSSYGGSAYKAGEEDSNLKKKRDILKNVKTPQTKLEKKPSTMILEKSL